MTHDEIVEAFDNLQPLLKKLSYSFNTTTGVPYEEIMGSCRLSLMKACSSWNPERGVGLPAYARQFITNEAINFCKKYHRISTWNGDIEETILNEPSKKTSESVHWEFRDTLEGLSREARIVADIVLHNDLPSWGTKKRLWSVLRHAKWDWKTIHRVDNELKMAFGN